ncbi:histamine N-methyltransferase-like [Brachionichthys hirsutus]|uniref:histamine N-methyltransferase-like n=1 Tax=Brachionichthys hirsutus TaxID=412623 RepID=UPI003604E6A6
MASPLKSLYLDRSSYLQAFKLFLECSTGYRCMKDFMDTRLPDVLASIVNGKSHLNVIGVGSGSGELDLKMLSVLHQNYPQMTVHNEVVEPDPQQLQDYRSLVSRTPGLGYITYKWNKMTAQEFEEQWKENKTIKKVDFIHMIQMLYCVEDAGATISFYQSLLDRNGKLLINQVTGDSGWGKLGKTYGKEFFNAEVSCVTSEDVKRLLASKGLSYRSYELPSETDITQCFIKGNERGEQLLDFVTQVQHFRKSASPELQAEIEEFLRSECSKETDDKVFFNYNSEVIVVDRLN